MPEEMSRVGFPLHYEPLTLSGWKARLNSLHNIWHFITQRYRFPWKPALPFLISSLCTRNISLLLFQHYLLHRGENTAYIPVNLLKRCCRPGAAPGPAPAAHCSPCTSTFADTPTQGVTPVLSSVKHPVAYNLQWLRIYRYTYLHAIARHRDRSEMCSDTVLAMAWATAIRRQTDAQTCQAVSQRRSSSSADCSRAQGLSSLAKSAPLNGEAGRK